MDPITGNHKDVYWGTQTLERIYYGSRRIWPWPTAGVAPNGADAMVILGNLTNNMTQSLGAMRSWFRNHPGQAWDSGLPATTSGGTAKEGLVNIMINNNAGSLAAGTDCSLVVSHNGHWWLMAMQALTAISPPFDDETPGNNPMKGFYVQGETDFGLTKTQLIARIPTNCWTIHADPATHIIEVLPSPGARGSLTYAPPLTHAYFLPPGMTDGDLIWPAGP